MRSPTDVLTDPRPGDVVRGYDEATVGHFTVYVDVVGARNIWFDVVRRFGETKSSKLPVDEFVAWIADTEVLNVAAE